MSMSGFPEYQKGYSCPICNKEVCRDRKNQKAMEIKSNGGGATTLDQFLFDCTFDNTVKISKINVSKEGNRRWTWYEEKIEEIIRGYNIAKTTLEEDFIVIN